MTHGRRRRQHRGLRGGGDRCRWRRRATPAGPWRSASARRARADETRGGSARQGRDAPHRLLARQRKRLVLGHVDRHPQRRARTPLANPHLEHPQPAVLDGELDVAHVARSAARGPPRMRRSSAATAGSRSSSTAIGSVACVPATTSSPWASNITSPYRTGSPVDGLRVKTTPVPESAPRLPKTMAWTVTAVPEVVRDALVRAVRHRAIRFHDRKTASIASRSCSHGSSGRSSRRPRPDSRREVGAGSRRRSVPAPVGCGRGRRHVAVGEAQVEDRVHHPGHRDRRAGPDADEQRIGAIAEAPADAPAEALHVLAELRVEPSRPLPVEIGAARLGRDGEPRRHRQPELARHHDQVRALAAEELSELFRRARRWRVEVVDVAVRGLHRRHHRRPNHRSTSDPDAMEAIERVAVADQGRRSSTSSWATTTSRSSGHRSGEATLLGLRRPALPAPAEPDVLRDRRLVADLRPHVPPLRHAVRGRLDHQERQRLPLHGGRARRAGLDRSTRWSTAPATAPASRSIPRTASGSATYLDATSCPSTASTSPTGGATGSCRRWSATSRSSREQLDRQDELTLAELAVLLEDAIDVHDRHWKIHWMLNFAQLSATLKLASGHGEDPRPGRRGAARPAPELGQRPQLGLDQGAVGDEGGGQGGSRSWPRPSATRPRPRSSPRWS